MTSDLNVAIDQRVKPIVGNAIRKHLGVSVSNIELDITDRLKKSALADFAINTSLPFKEAKKAFKRTYLARLLQTHLGNISTAAGIAGIDRRSMHRLVASLRIPTTRIRETANPAYVRQTTVKNVIQEVLEQYKPALNPAKYKALSAHAESLSEEIIKELPEEHLSFKEAEHEFEKAYFARLANECRTIAAMARKAGLRYEVVHRKLKALKIQGISKGTGIQNNTLLEEKAHNKHTPSVDMTKTSHQYV